MCKFIMNIIERILNGKFISEDELKVLLTNYYNKGRKEGRNAGYKEGYNDCLKKYNLSENTTSPMTSSKAEGISHVILFLKADRGKDVTESVRQAGKLDSHLAESLYENTQYIWVGASNSINRDGILSIFGNKGKISEFGPEYDSVAILVVLDKPIKADLTDSFKIHEFINRLCGMNCKCERISDRLPLDAIQSYKLIDI